MERGGVSGTHSEASYMEAAPRGERVASAMRGESAAMPFDAVCAMSMVVAEDLHGGAEVAAAWGDNRGGTKTRRSGSGR